MLLAAYAGLLHDGDVYHTPFPSSLFFPSLHDAEKVDLGYIDAVERCDSVDLGEVDFDELRNGSAPKTHANGGKPMDANLKMAFGPGSGFQVRKSR